MVFLKVEKEHNINMTWGMYQYLYTISVLFHWVISLNRIVAGRGTPSRARNWALV